MALLFSAEYTRQFITVPNRPIMPSIGSEDSFATFTTPLGLVSTDVLIIGVIPAGVEIVGGLVRNSARLSATSCSIEVGVHRLVTDGVYPKLSTDTALITATGGDIDCFVDAYDCLTARSTQYFIAPTDADLTGFDAVSVPSLLTVTLTLGATGEAGAIFKFRTQFAKILT